MTNMLFLDEYHQFVRFMEQGGLPLLAIFFTSIVLWGFVIERYIFVRYYYSDYLEKIARQWEKEQLVHPGGYAHRLHTTYIESVRTVLQDKQSLIRALISIMLLLGLLGTVVGMISLFEETGRIDGNSARGLSAGIAKALFPTTAGLVTSLIGLYVQSALSRRIEVAFNQARDQLSW